MGQDGNTVDGSMLMGIKQKVSRALKAREIHVEMVDRCMGRRLEGHTALVTGGGSGIGLAIAERFYAEGAAVIVVGRDKQKLKAASEGKRDDHFSYCVCDMANINQIETTFRKVIDDYKVDILVNNAGAYVALPFLEINEFEWSRILDTNLTGSFFAMQAFCRARMEMQSTGRVVNICSNTGILGATSCYSASKWGLVGLTRGLGKEMARYGIAINGIAPGMVASPINGIDPAGDLESRHSDDGRIAVPDEIAEIALFLASDASAHIVGQVIVCDGGESLTCTYC